MAKVNKYSLRPQIWLVRVTVSDPHCTFSINPNISYDKVIRASNAKAAVKEVATYCIKKMQQYPGTQFTYSADNVAPYYYPVHMSHNEPTDKVFFTKSKI